MRLPRLVAWVSAFALGACAEAHGREARDPERESDTRTSVQDEPEGDARSSAQDERETVSDEVAKPSPTTTVVHEGPAPSAILDAPSDWPRVVGQCGFSFRAPELAVIDRPAVDDLCVSTFESADCDYTAARGLFTPSFERNPRDPDSKQEATTVSGSPGQLVTDGFPNGTYSVALYVPNYPPGGPRDASVTVIASCKSRAAADTARVVLPTLELARGELGHCEAERLGKCPPIE